ncbi:membrane protein [Leptolyngbya sp. Heron Island J]|uniref:hypothetical protein n=1 Tax=Leptolyngbya sp. Heron Island J TaxID=1385935 RepID=UPI0003B9D8DF|nr:hypothetical protein [Leptolyngbya sp. Heron Island J]ESA32022.1 membrane protein [Leptolyngbya sp. Heron Island J]
MAQNTETTRYLCGAAQLDQGFANRVIDETLDVNYKAINLPSGIDINTVLKHCLNSRKRKNRRDLIITGIVFSILISGYRLLIPGLIAIYIVTFFEAWATRYKIIANSLLRKNFNPNIPILDGDSNAQKRLGAIQYRNSSNVIVYSGYSPFVGAGFEIGGWSFALNIGKGKNDLAGVTENPQDFNIKEIHEHIGKNIKDLRVKNLTIKDELYINGQEIRDDKRFLPDHLSSPISQVDQKTLDKFIERPTEEIRHYQVFRIFSWKGDIVLSIFLRFIKVGNNLFSEASYAVLPPLKKKYRAIDEIQQNPTLRKISELGGELCITSLYLCFKAPISSIGRLINLYTKNRDRRRLKTFVKNTPTFDYGATTNIREIASSDKYRQYFQQLDKDMYIKLVERNILDSIISFLDSKGIDTSDLKDRQTTILNNGVMISGGALNAKNVAVGTEAKASSGFSLPNLTQPQSQPKT